MLAVQGKFHFAHPVKIALPDAFFQLDHGRLKERFDDLHEKEGVPLRLPVQPFRQRQYRIASTRHLASDGFNSGGRKTGQVKLLDQPFTGPAACQALKGCRRPMASRAERADDQNRVAGRRRAR